jgi:class 3 adenylate cyclase
VAAYQRAAAKTIPRFGSHVAKYLGDGVMTYFGWPEAHDNEAERAARADLAIFDALAKINQQPKQTKLSARAGIDSGTVAMIGAGVGQDADVFGGRLLSLREDRWRPNRAAFSRPRRRIA